MDTSCKKGSAIIFFSGEDPEEPVSLPLMLQPMLFCPVAVWVAQALTDAGVEHFFVVCHEKYKEKALACFPDGKAWIASDPKEAPGQLASFLAENAKGPVLAVTQPVLISYAGARQLTSEESWPAGDAASGIFRADSGTLLGSLPQTEDLLALCTSTGEQYLPMDETLVIPILSGFDLNRTQSAGRRSVVRRHMERGVYFTDPETAYIDPRVQIGSGTTVLPGTILRGGTVIGNDCEIGPNTMITNCKVGDGTSVNASQLNDSTVGSQTTVGPFAYIRPNCTIADHVKIGDFVEVKNSMIGTRSKVPHLTYVGDADVGDRVNLGCGTITVNYDGQIKSRSVVKDGAFVGCNANLVAPVTVGEGAYVAAGSTVTDNVPAESLAIARSQQTNKLNWANKRKKNKSQKTER